MSNSLEAKNGLFIEVNIGGDHPQKEVLNQAKMHNPFAVLVTLYGEHLKVQSTKRLLKTKIQKSSCLPLKIL